jgi:hypothetical protein
MKAQEGENNVNIARQNLLPLDAITISPLRPKVNGPHEQWAQIQRRFASGEKIAIALIDRRSKRVMALVASTIPMV